MHMGCVGAAHASVGKLKKSGWPWQIVFYLRLVVYFEPMLPSLFIHKSSSCKTSLNTISRLFSRAASVNN
jgi:hypothetical protein